jgi:hypothetical protein
MLRMLAETAARLHPSNDFSIFRRLCGAGAASNRHAAIKEK